MDSSTNQLLVQTLNDTIRVVMVLSVLVILSTIYGGMKLLMKMIGNLIVKGCKHIWGYIRKTPSEPVIPVTAEQNAEV